MKGLGRYLLWGTIATVLFGIGFIFWALAGLRALQTETGSVFTGHWSWAPYLITFVASIFVISLSVFAIFKEQNAAKKRKARRKAESV